jgi:hypothetical protein
MTTLTAAASSRRLAELRKAVIMLDELSDPGHAIVMRDELSDVGDTIVMRDDSAGQPPSRTSRLGIFSLLIGALSLVLWIAIDRPTPLPGGIAVVLGFLALCVIDRSNGQLKGRRLAKAGFLLGAVNLFLVVVFLGLGGSSNRFA